LFTVLSGLVLGILTHAQSRTDRDRLYAHLSSYLPAPVAAALALQSPSSAIKASEQQVTVFFADIRNFSAYVEARPPEEAAAVLHTFFSVATQMVESHDGVIESFQGDAVLAVWSGEHQASRALQAAIGLQQALQHSLPDPAPPGLEPLALGIGIETGRAMVGSFGPVSRRTHLVLGRTVTVASRLVEMTAELAHPILVGEGMLAQLGGRGGLISMGTFLLDGLRVPHHIYAYPLVSAPSIHPS
jgi:adenylate cyclase